MQTETSVVLHACVVLVILGVALTVLWWRLGEPKPDAWRRGYKWAGEWLRTMPAAGLETLLTLMDDVDFTDFNAGARQALEEWRTTCPRCASCKPSVCWRVDCPRYPADTVEAA
jgi:hypothetical protein